MIKGASDIKINVQAWQSHKVELYGLSSYIKEKDRFYDDPRFPLILPAIENTYNLLVNYHPERLGNYLPDRLGVWVGDYISSDNFFLWPLKYPRLTDIAAQKLTAGVSQHPSYLTGEKADTLYREFNYSIKQCGLQFSEDGNVFAVYVRPLLPDEFSENQVDHPETLSCYLSDGWSY